MDTEDDEKTFSEWLEAAIDGSLYLGSSTEDLRDEIYNNMWYFSGSSKDTARFSVVQLKQWLEDVIADRERQLLAYDPVRRAIFYLWVDTQLAQLRFNLISDAHVRLPFGRRYTILETPESVIEEFLARLSNGNGWLDTNADNWDEFLQNQSLDIYAVALPRSTWKVSDWAKSHD